MIGSLRSTCYSPLFTEEYGSQPASVCGTVGRTSPGTGEGSAMQEQLPGDAAVERTGMYLQRVPKAYVG